MTYNEYCVEFLEHLNYLGFHGIYNLLYSTIGSLIDRRKQLIEVNDDDDEMMSKPENAEQDE